MSRFWNFDGKAVVCEDCGCVVARDWWHLHEFNCAGVSTGSSDDEDDGDEGDV